VLALVQASGFIDANFGAESGCFGKLLQFCVQVAAALGQTGGAGRAFRSRVLTDKDVMFEEGQVVISWGN
jgi:hypothetical protein